MCDTKKAASIVLILILSVICVCCTFPGSASYAEELNESIDFAFEPNGDGTVNVSDAVLLLRCLTEDRTINPEVLAKAELSACDYDGDGLLTLSDAARLLQYLQNGV